MSTLDNALPETRMEPLNLARRPFLNSRPVVRISLLLWVLGLVLLLANVYFFWDYLTRSADKRQQIARGEQEIERQRAVARELESRLDHIDLRNLNAKVDFLNQKIAERTFSWSLLLDRLAAVQPNDVRLNRLAPQTGERAKRDLQRLRENRPDASAEEIFLVITGESRSDTALLRFVDNLFDLPFREPNLTRTERGDDNLVKFELHVFYIPGQPSAPVIEEAPILHEEGLPRRAPTARSTPPRAPSTPSGGQP